MINRPTNPIVSLVIPIWNREEDIDHLFQDIKNQEFKDFEVIIVNDGSEDNTKEKIRSESIKYNNINFKVIDTVHNGVSAARNIGIKASKGEYIVFADSDDRFGAEYIKSLIESTNEADLVCGGYIISNERENIRKEFERNILQVKDFRNMYDSSDSIIPYQTVWGKRYKKSLIIKYSIMFDENELIGEDIDFNLRYLNVSHMVQTIENTNYIYIRHRSSTMMQYNPSRWQQLKRECIRREIFFNYNNKALIRWTFLYRSLVYYSKMYRTRAIDIDELNIIFNEIKKDTFYSDALLYAKTSGTRDMRIVAKMLENSLNTLVFNYITMAYISIIEMI